MDLVMLGLPGAGKGTQAELLAARLGVPWISTGDLFRAAIRERTPLGEKASSFMERGDLVPDDVVVAMVEDRLKEDDSQAGFVLDGFPRTVPQADQLDESLKGMQRELDHVIYLNVAEDEVVRRLSSRRVCKACGKLQHLSAADAVACVSCDGELVQRKDDKEEVVRDRLRVFREQTAPLLSRYEQAEVLRTIDGTGSLNEVTDRIFEALNLEQQAAR